MARLTQTAIESRVEEINAEACTKIDALADQWRTEVLIPWCRKHHLIVLIGNGSWCFYNQKGVAFDGWEQKKFQPIHDTLNQVIGHSAIFGYHVESVREEDLV